MGINCPKCHFENPDGMRFCVECGNKLEISCPNCGFKNAPSFKFCGECGQNLVAPPKEITKAVIYVIRNPLDVSVSFAHHTGYTINRIINIMSDNNYSFCSQDNKLQIRAQMKPVCFLS